MRKVLMASAIMLAMAPAGFAAAPQVAGIAGDVNLSRTAATSVAGVQSEQGTTASVKAGGNGAVIVGTLSGNTTSVRTTAAAQAIPGGSATQTTATQTNLGGTVSGGFAINEQGRHAMPAGASGVTDGYQSSVATGNASATASDKNLGGFVVMAQPAHGRAHR